MKTPQIVANLPVLVLGLIGTGCGESIAPEASIHTNQDQIPKTDIEILKVAKVVLDSDIEWKDSITKDGRIAKLFQAPAPDPDETIHYRVKEGEALFAIILARFGSAWQGTVIDLLGEVPMRQFEQPSAEECISAIQAAFQFTGEYEKVLGCAFP